MLETVWVGANLTRVSRRQASGGIETLSDRRQQGRTTARADISGPVRSLPGFDKRIQVCAVDEHPSESPPLAAAFARTEGRQVDDRDEPLQYVVACRPE